MKHVSVLILSVFLPGAAHASGIAEGRQTERYQVPAGGEITLYFPGAAVKVQTGSTPAVIVENEEMISPAGFVVTQSVDGSLLFDSGDWKARHPDQLKPYFHVIVPEGCIVNMAEVEEVEYRRASGRFVVATGRVEFRECRKLPDIEIRGSSLLVRDTLLPATVRAIAGSVEIRDSRFESSILDFGQADGCTFLLRYVKGKTLDLILGRGGAIPSRIFRCSADAFTVRSSGAGVLSVRSSSLKAFTATGGWTVEGVK